MSIRQPDKEKASEAARMLGSIRTEKKIAAANANLAKVKHRGKPHEKNPLDLTCTCGAGTDTVIGDGHKTTCPRGRLLYQRAKVAARKAESNASS